MTAHDTVRIESVSGFGVSHGGSTINTVTNAAINADGATLENKTGPLYLTTRADSLVSTDGDLFVANYFTGSGSAVATTNTDTTHERQREQLDAERRRPLSAGRREQQRRAEYSHGFCEHRHHGFLDVAEHRRAAAECHGERNQYRQYHRHDESCRRCRTSNLIAIQGIGGDQRAKTDGSERSHCPSFPYGFPVPDGSHVSSTNNVNIGTSATVEAGLNNKTQVLVKPIGSLPVSRLDTQLTDAEKTALNLSPDVQYVYGRLDLSSITFTVSTGTVVHAVSGAIGGGTAGKYYQYLPQTTAGDEVILDKEDYSNTSRWHLMTDAEVAAYTADTSKAAPYESDVTKNFATALTDQFYAIKPVNLPSPTLAYKNLGTVLLDERETVLGWMASHASDAEAVARYQVQLDLIDETLASFGLLDGTPGPNGTTINQPRRELDGLFLEMPSVYASPGSIYIQADESNRAAAQAAVAAGNRLFAKSGANITIGNEAPFSLVVNDAVILDDSRITTVNGQLVELKPGQIYFNFSALTTAPPADPATITITQASTSGFTIPGLTLPDVPVDIYLAGDVINNTGDITVTNPGGSINVSGDLRGANVHIVAGKDFNLNTQSWFHTNADPRQYIDYQTLRALLFNTDGTTRSLSDLSGTDLVLAQQQINAIETAINTDTSSILALGRIAITAEFLDINGLIQSGVQTLTLNVASTFTANQTEAFVGSDGKTISGINFGPDNVPLSGHFDAQQNALVLDDVVSEGGRIVLAGQILSTGNGRLQVANGLTSVNIDNESQYKLIVNKIDTTTDRVGVITIVDTSRSPEDGVHDDTSSGVQEMSYNGTPRRL